MVDRQEVSNYRPISILPFMSKILEKLIYCRLINHLDDNHTIHDNQFGFQKNKATYVPILLLQDTITRVFEEGEFALGLYLDIKKAFETVNIRLLLNKLYKYGIRNKSLKIITSYLHERTQQVKIRNSCSSFRNITMGVPQGSILGPILFIIYLNDLPKISDEMTCLSYADDTAIIFKNKSSSHLQVTVDKLLLRISDWFNANFLSLNVTKTYTQHYTTRSSDFKLKVSINNIAVEEKANLKYLGVVIDKSLKFTKHIANISNVISRNIGIIARVRYFLDKRTAHILYNSLILPYLNYCCLTRAPLWYFYNAPHWGEGGLFRAPPLISETTGPILKIQTAFERHGKTVEGKQILLTSGSRVTSQVRSKSKCSTFRAW